MYHLQAIFIAYHIIMYLQFFALLIPHWANDYSNRKDVTLVNEVYPEPRLQAYMNSLILLKCI